MLPKSEKNTFQTAVIESGSQIQYVGELQYLVWTERYSPAGLNDVWCHNMTCH